MLTGPLFQLSWSDHLQTNLAQQLFGLSPPPPLKEQAAFCIKTAKQFTGPAQGTLLAWQNLLLVMFSSNLSATRMPCSCASQHKAVIEIINLKEAKSLSFPCCPLVSSCFYWTIWSQSLVRDWSKVPWKWSGALGKQLVSTQSPVCGNSKLLCVPLHLPHFIMLLDWSAQYLSLPLLQLWAEDDKLDVLKQILPIPSGLCHSSCLKSCFLAQPEHCNKWGESLSDCGWCRRGLWKQSLVLGSEGCFRQNKYKCCHLTDLFPLSLPHSSPFAFLWANQAMHSSLVTVTHLGHPRESRCRFSISVKRTWIYELP